MQDRDQCYASLFGDDGLQTRILREFADVEPTWQSVKAYHDSAVGFQIEALGYVARTVMHNARGSGAVGYLAGSLDPPLDMIRNAVKDYPNSDFYFIDLTLRVKGQLALLLDCEEIEYGIRAAEALELLDSIKAHARYPALNKAFSVPKALVRFFPGGNVSFLESTLDQSAQALRLGRAFRYLNFLDTSILHNIDDDIIAWPIMQELLSQAGNYLSSKYVRPLSDAMAAYYAACGQE